LSGRRRGCLSRRFEKRASESERETGFLRFRLRPTFPQRTSAPDLSYFCVFFCFLRPGGQGPTFPKPHPSGPPLFGWKSPAGLDFSAGHQPPSLSTPRPPISLSNLFLFFRPPPHPWGRKGFHLPCLEHTHPPDHFCSPAIFSGAPDQPGFLPFSFHTPHLFPFGPGNCVFLVFLMTLRPPPTHPLLMTPDGSPQIGLCCTNRE
jgi:hypothetical protein